MKKIILGLTLVTIISSFVFVACKKQAVVQNSISQSTSQQKTLGETAKKIHGFVLNQQKLYSSSPHAKVDWGHVGRVALQDGCSFGMGFAECGWVPYWGLGYSVACGVLGSMMSYPHIHPVSGVTDVQVPFNSSNPYENIGIIHNSILATYYSTYAGASATSATKESMTNNIISVLTPWMNSNYPNSNVNWSETHDKMMNSSSYVFVSNFDDCSYSYNSFVNNAYASGNISYSAQSILLDFATSLDDVNDNNSNLQTICDGFINFVAGANDISDNEKAFLLQTLTIGKYSAFFHCYNFKQN